MATPTERSLEVFARSNDDVACGLLINALEREDKIGEEAVSIITKHGNRRAKFELIRCIESLSTTQKAAVYGKTAAYSEALKQAIQGQVDGDRDAAYRWIDVVDDFDQFGTLLARLNVAEEGEQTLALQTLETLCERLFDRLDGRSGKSSRDAEALRRPPFTALLEALDDIEQQPFPHRLVEWALIISTFNHGDANKVLAKIRETETDQINESLLQSVHPGILRVPLDLMRKTYPFEIGFEVLRSRKDQAFVQELLRQFPKEPTVNQVENFRQITSLPWLSPDPKVLQEIPQPLHLGLTRLVKILGIDESDKQEILCWLLKNGDRTTREEASSQFETIDKSESHAILKDSLVSDDPAVRAWATSQLRKQEVPDAFALLIARLDSEFDEVRTAAQRHLSDINLRRALGMLELTPEKVTPAFGVLLRKINPQIDLELRRELAHSIRVRRVNAIRLAGALGMVEEVMSGITALIDDTDTLVRRTAVEMLGSTANRDSLNALMRATEDKSPRVRGAAVSALQQIRVQLAAQEAASAPVEPARPERPATPAESAEMVRAALATREVELAESEAS